MIRNRRKGKRWFTSKTLIVNALAAALLALEGVTGILQPYMSVNFYVALAVSLPLINSVLRVVTNEGIER